MSLKIIPVELISPRMSMSTFVMLDEDPTATLIDINTAHLLGADGPQLNLALKRIRDHKSVGVISRNVTV